MNGKKKLIRTYQQTIMGELEEIFPLLCPVREKEWLEGWDYRMLYSERGYAEKGCVFETSNDYGRYLWVITKHDRNNYEIQFVKTVEKEMVVIIDISLHEKDKKITHCNIQYTFIALSEHIVEEMIKENSVENFNTHMKKWESSLNYYLQHGEMLKE